MDKFERFFDERLSVTNKKPPCKRAATSPFCERKKTLSLREY